METPGLLNSLNKDPHWVSIETESRNILRENIKGHSLNGTKLQSFLSELGLNIPKEESLQTIDCSSLSICFTKSRRNMPEKDLIQKFLDKLSLKAEQRKTLDPIVKQFLQQLLNKVEESVLFFTNEQENYNMNKFKIVLNEVLESTELEFLRLNSFSEVSDKRSRLSDSLNSNKLSRTLTNLQIKENKNEHLLTNIKSKFETMNTKIEQIIEELSKDIGRSDNVCVQMENSKYGIKRELQMFNQYLCCRIDSESGESKLENLFKQDFGSFSSELEGTKLTGWRLGENNKFNLKEKKLMKKSLGNNFEIKKILEYKKNKTSSNLEKEISSLKNKKTNFGFFRVSKQRDGDLESISTDRMLKEFDNNYSEDEMDVINPYERAFSEDQENSFEQDESKIKKYLSDASDRENVFQKNPFMLVPENKKEKSEIESQLDVLSREEESDCDNNINIAKITLNQNSIDFSKSNEQVFGSPEISLKLSERLKHILDSSESEEQNLLQNRLRQISNISGGDSLSKMMSEQFNYFGSNLVSHMINEFLKPQLKEEEKMEIETNVKEMSRNDLEKKVIQVEEDFALMRIPSDEIKSSVASKISTLLKRMQKESYKHLKESLKSNEGEIKSLRNSLDMIRMENIELEFGLIKLSQIYNEIIFILGKNEIELEVQREKGEGEKNSVKQKVAPFSLKEFREQIKQKIQLEKYEMDKDLKKFREIKEEEEENIEIISDTEQEPSYNKKSKTQNSWNISEHQFSRGKSLLLQRPDKHYPKRLSIIEKSASNHVSPRGKQQIWQRSESFFMDFGRTDKMSEDNKGVLSSNSGVVLTIKEMKEEYYNTKKYNVELIAENLEVNKLNNELNCQVFALKKDKQEMQTRLKDLQSENEELHKNNLQEELDELQKVNYMLIEEKRLLLEDLQGLKEFFIDNLKKVRVEMKQRLVEINQFKKEMISRMYHCRLEYKETIVSSVLKLNENLNLVLLMNTTLEDERKKIIEINESIQKLSESGVAIEDCQSNLCAIHELTKEIMKLQEDSSLDQEGLLERESVNNNSLSEEGLSERENVNNNSLKEKKLMDELENLRISNNQNNTMDEGNDLKTSSLIHKQLCSYSESKSNNRNSSQYTSKEQKASIDYNKEIYSEYDMDDKGSSQEVNIHTNYLDSIDKLSSQRKSIFQFGSQSFNRSEKQPSDAQSDSNSALKRFSQFQINYEEEKEKSNSELEESEEYDNGMDVLLQEYISNPANSNRLNSNEGVNPPYNTERNKSVNLEEYILKPEDKVHILDNNYSDKKEESKTFDINLKSNGELLSEDSYKRQKKGKVSGNFYYSQSEEMDRVKKTTQNTFNARYNDRESGFENICEKLIFAISHKNEILEKKINDAINQQLVSLEHNQTWSQLSNDVDDNSGIQLLRKIEALEENEKQEIGKSALEMIGQFMDESVGLGSRQISIKNSGTQSSIKNVNSEELEKRLKQMKSENSFLIIDLQKLKIKIKNFETENSQIKSDNLELIKQSNELETKVLTLENRIDFLTSDNRTDMGTEYDDMASNFDDIHSERLSNNMLVIKEEDDEGEEEGDSVKDKQSNQLPKIIIKGDNVIVEHPAETDSIDTKSNYSFFKDYGKSEVDDAEEQAGSSTHSKKIYSSVSHKLKRRATTGGSSGSKDKIKDQIRDYSRSGTSRLSKSRKTISSIGRSMVKKSDTSNSDIESQLFSPENFQLQSDLGNFKGKHTAGSKSIDPHKINLNKIITSNEIPKSLYQSMNKNASGNLKHSSSLLSDQNQDSKTFKFQNESFTNSEILNQISPMVSILSQNKSTKLTNNKFDFSKNFEDLEEKSEGEIQNEDKESMGMDIGKEESNKNYQDFDILQNFTFSSSSSDGFKKFKSDWYLYRNDTDINKLKTMMQNKLNSQEKLNADIEMYTERLVGIVQKVEKLKEIMNVKLKQVSLQKKPSIKTRISSKLDIVLGDKSPMRSSSSKKLIPIQKNNALLQKFLEKKKEGTPVLSENNTETPKLVLKKESEKQLNDLTKEVKDLYTLVVTVEEETDLNTMLAKLKSFIQEKVVEQQVSLSTNKIKYKLREKHNDSLESVSREEICIKDGNYDSGLKQYNSVSNKMNNKSEKDYKQKSMSEKEILGYHDNMDCSPTEFIINKYNISEIKDIEFLSYDENIQEEQIELKRNSIDEFSIDNSRVAYLKDKNKELNRLVNKLRLNFDSSLELEINEKLISEIKNLNKHILDTCFGYMKEDEISSSTDRQFENKLKELKEAYLLIEKEMNKLKLENRILVENLSKEEFEDMKIKVKEEMEKKQEGVEDSMKNPVREISLHNEDEFLKEMMVDIIEVFCDEETSPDEKINCIEFMVSRSYHYLKNNHEEYLTEQLKTSTFFNTAIEEEHSYVEKRVSMHGMNNIEENEFVVPENEFEDLICTEADLEPELNINKKTLTEIREEEDGDNYTSQENNNQSSRKVSPSDKKEVKINFSSSPLIDNQVMADDVHKRKSKSLTQLKKYLQGQSELSSPMVEDKEKTFSDELEFMRKEIIAKSNRLIEMEDSMKALKGKIEAKNEEMEENELRNEFLENQFREAQLRIRQLEEEGERKTKIINSLKLKINNLKDLNRDLAAEFETTSYDVKTSSHKLSNAMSSPQQKNSPMKVNITIDHKSLRNIGQEGEIREEERTSEKKTPANTTQKKIRFFNLAEEKLYGGSKDRSEFPKGFSFDAVTNEEVERLKEKIVQVEKEKNEILEELEEMKENSKLKVFKLKDKISDLEEQLRKMKQNEKKTEIFHQQKLITTSQKDIQLKKKEEQIKKLRRYIEKLQKGVNNLSESDQLRESDLKSDSSHNLKPSKTETTNRLYSHQQED